MSLSFLPTMIVDTITDLSPRMLKERGIQLLMLDFDNTIVPYTTSVPTTLMSDWLKAMVQSEIKLCVVSNSKKPRPVRFCKKYGIPCITHAKKPSSKGLREAMELFRLMPEECALAGDQIFTDTLAARRAGAKAILVKPIDNHNFWLKARHVLEKPIIFCARKRRIKL